MNYYFQKRGLLNTVFMQNIIFLKNNFSESGAATRCCYLDGLLQYAGDAINASYSSSVHIDGAAPFGPGLTPLMSHWFADVVPYYWCCAWTDSLTTCRNNYANRRTTPDCDNYDPPSIGKISYCGMYITLSDDELRFVQKVHPTYASGHCLCRHNCNPLLPHYHIPQLYFVCNYLIFHL